MSKLAREEWFAQKIWGELQGRDHCKSYDPLLIEGSTAHSYIFNFKDGGRHHPFTSLKELEGWLVDELKQSAKFYVTELIQNADDPVSDLVVKSPEATDE